MPNAGPVRQVISNDDLPFTWTGVPKQTPVAPVEPRRRPARGDVPENPHPMHLPAAPVVPTTEADRGAVPVIEPHAGTDTSGRAPGGQPATGPDEATAGETACSRLSAAAAARHGVALHKPATVQTLLDLDAAELAALVAAGALLEVQPASLEIEPSSVGEVAAAALPIVSVVLPAVLVSSNSAAIRLHSTAVAAWFRGAVRHLWRGGVMMVPSDWLDA